MKQKLEVEFMNKKDLYFIVGNLKSHKNSLMIIGVVYTTSVSQLSLF